jgi:hypothetical protein
MYLCGTILNVLADHLVDVVLHIRDAKALWDHLNARNELYIMENFHDYKMVGNLSIVEQAHVF